MNEFEDLEVVVTHGVAEIFFILTRMKIICAKIKHPYRKCLLEHYFERNHLP